MCPLVGPHAPSFGRQLWGLPSHVDYPSPQGILLPRVYGTTASPLWLELRGPAAWQATPSWTVDRLACHRLLPWLRVTFAMLPDAAWPGSDQQPWGTAPAAGQVGRLGRPSAPDPWGVVGCCPSLSRPRHARVCGVLGHLAPGHLCARSVCCFARAVSWATWLLFTGVPVWCAVLRVRCPGPLGSCSPVCPLGVLSCACGVLGHLVPVHQCARSVRCLAFASSWAPWLLFTGLFARCVVSRLRCPGPLGSCSPVCPFCALSCVCGVLGHFAPVHRCARSVCCPARAVSWATWFLFTGVPARCAALRVRCPGPLGSCSSVCLLGALCRVCGVLGHLAPVHQCARSVRCPARAASWTTWLLVTGVPTRCAALRLRCPGPLGSCSPVCSLGALCCSCGVLGHLAPVHRCARSACCVACAVSLATWLLFIGLFARCVVSRVRCSGPLGSCSPVCPLGALSGACGVLDNLASGHRCTHSVRCLASAVSWATWLLFTSVLAWCVVLLVWCPWPLGSCSPVRSLGVLCCLCGVLGHLAPVHRCVRWVRCAACARCSGPLDSCSPVCSLGALSCVRGVLGHLAPVHRCARLVCCVVVRCRGPLPSCSPVCPLGALCCVCGDLGHFAPVQRCARWACCVACAVFWATWLLFNGVLVRCVALLVCGVLGHLAPVHRCARTVCCVTCAVSWAIWLQFTGVPTRCVALRVCGVLGHLTPVPGVVARPVVLRVRCSGPLGSCSPLRTLGVLCCCAVSLATALLFTGVPARCFVLRVRCPGPLGPHISHEVAPPYLGNRHAGRGGVGGGRGGRGGRGGVGGGRGG